MDVTRPRFSEKTIERYIDTENSGFSPEVTMTKPRVNRKITPEEVTAQDKTKPWFVVHGEVYDGKFIPKPLGTVWTYLIATKGTAFLKDHPGGGDSISLVAGQDATEDFMAIHSTDARAQLAEVRQQFNVHLFLFKKNYQWPYALKFHIGTLSGRLIQDTLNVTEAQSSSNTSFLNPSKWKKVKLVDVKKINHDSSTFRFSLPDVNQLLGLPVGQHVFVRLMRKDTHEIVQRAYTPISKENELGFIDFLIKSVDLKIFTAVIIQSDEIIQTVPPKRAL
jgi:nitrate reductase (NAD(P)H)